MAVMEIDIPSGFSADLESSKTKLDYAKKTEIRDEKTVVLYYDEVRVHIYHYSHYMLISFTLPLSLLTV
jgi:hypothetical protein